ncbi:MAG: stage II sporulation protein M [Candidatus Krumholzibacteriia bacterium]
MTRLRMKSVLFRREREAGWRELEGLLARVERGGLGRLDAAELERLPVLYRAAVSSLSVAGAISLDQSLHRYLSALAARAYIWVYGVRRPLRQGISHFLAATLPRSVRHLAPMIALSASLLGLGAGVAFVMVTLDPGHYFAFVPEGLQQGRTPYAGTDELRDALAAQPSLGEMSAFAGTLFVNNAHIAVLAFALGIAAGVPSALMMFVNGLTIGAFLALYVSRGLGWDLGGWLLVHGVTELGAVILAGAAGMAVGRALLAPGRRPRREALLRAGREAGVVALGAAGMLAVAAFMEAFARQLLQATPVRWAWAMGTLALWLVYFLRAGRRPFP